MPGELDLNAPGDVSPNINNELPAPEDDGSICLIDYGISRKIDQLSGPEKQQKIE